MDISTSFNNTILATSYDSHSFYHGFISALSITLISELGDKTFFIAAIMSMRHSRLIVFSGAILALIVMTILSSAMGFLITNIPRYIVLGGSALLFFIFGLKMLREGYKMTPDEGQEEFNEVQEEILRKEQHYKPLNTNILESLEEGNLKASTKIKSISAKIYYKLFDKSLTPVMCTIAIQAFTLTFLAEWGDRSQITTIILSAKEDIFGVSLGAILGHSLCTLLAVLAGRYVSSKLSVRLVTLIGGLVFIVFGITTILFDKKYE